MSVPESHAATGTPGRRGTSRWARALVPMLALFLPAQAANFVVTSTADSGAGTLRAAITSANSTAGADTITFSLTACPCVITLASTLTVSEALTITGPGQANLAIDGNNAVRLFNATAGPLTMTDLTLRKGNAAAANGGAILTAGGTALSLSNVAIQNSAAANGGGVYAGGTANVTNSVLENNTAAAGGSGGGIYAAGTLSLAGATLSGNTAGNYGGGAMATGAATVTNSVFRSNTATAFDGGGMYVSGAATISGSTFSLNKTSTTKGYGGGGGMISFGVTAITDTDFIGNTSADWGGGAYLAYFTNTTPTTLANVEFVGNTALGGGGGGAFIWFDSVLTAVTFEGNYASYRGGGLYAGYAGTYSVTVNGGGFGGNSGAAGGGLWSDTSVTVDGSLFDYNVSRNGNGGGIATAASATVSNATISNNSVVGGNGGGIDAAANLVLTNTTLTGNRTLTGSGGGTGVGGNATVTDSRFANNTAFNLGGGMIAYGNATVTRGEFTGNVAENNWGGGAFVNQAATFDGTSFTQNTSKYAGGGLAVQAGTVQVTGATFQGNQANTNGFGGAIYFGGPTLTMSGTELISNSSDGPGGAVAGGAMDISQSLFRQNQTTGDGGAIAAFGNLTLARSRLIANQASMGGGLVQTAGTGLITNTLFARNHATSANGEAMALAGTTSVRHVTVGNGAVQAGGSAIYVNGGSTQVQNSIASFHAIGMHRFAGTASADSNLFSNDGIAVFGTVTNTNTYTGNPAFVDVANDDYHLGVGSAAIDLGPSVGVSGDIDGEARPLGGGFDAGYDERAPTAQSIVFAALGAKTFGDAPFTVSATGGASGNPVTFSSTTTGVCTVAGNTVTLVAAGTCTIAANQAGNPSYVAAVQVTQSFTVGKASQSIAFGTLAGKALGDAPFTVSATGGASGNPVTFSATTPAVCTVAGSTVTLVAVGTCTIAADQAGNANYNAAPQVTRSFTVASNTATPRLVNISTRMQVLTGDNVLIGGFIIGGAAPKQVVVRARGPSLIPAGVPNAIANPKLDLYSGQTVIVSNDDWQQAANAAAIQTSGFAPGDPLESAILVTLNPGAYTAVVSGVNNATGVGIIEVFEVDHPEIPLLNISTRGLVLTGGDAMIGGFVIQGDAPQTVVVRARGPSLVPFGIANALADPVLQLFSGQAVIASNDDWQQAANAGAIQTAGFAPADAKEAVILITLPPGAYTAIVSGKNGGTGVGIIEVFAQ